MSLDCRRKPEILYRHRGIRRTPHSLTEPACCVVTVLTPALLCCSEGDQHHLCGSHCGAFSVTLLLIKLFPLSSSHVQLEKDDLEPSPQLNVHILSDTHTHCISVRESL